MYTISRFPRRRWPRCSWHTRHQNQMWLTPTPMGHQDPTNWCLRRSRETFYSLATPDVQRKRNHDHAQWATPRHPPAEAFLYICDYLCRKSQYHQRPLWNNRPRDRAGSRMVDGRSVDSAKANLLLYYLLIYKGRTQRYIRTPIRVPSWVLRLQSYLVACGYLVDKYVTLCLIITWQHSQIDQNLRIDLFGAPPGIFPRYLKRTYSVESPDRKQYGWETDRWRWKPEKA